MMYAQSGDTLQHDSQAIVQSDTFEKVVEKLDLIAQIDKLVAEHAEKVLPFAGDMDAAKRQARRWVVEAITERLAGDIDCDVIFIQYSHH